MAADGHGSMAGSLWVTVRLWPSDRGYRTGAGPGDAGATAGKALARRNAAVIAVAATVTFLMLLVQSLANHRLSGIFEYDDGVYFGSSLALAHGIVPYGDYAFIQPPMISVLLLPFAWLSSATGTAVGMEAARIFTDVVTVLNVVLTGLLVRHKTTLRVTTTVGIMAFYPATVLASWTVLLEPYLVLLCLLALVVVFRGDTITTSWQMALAGGLIFGVAGATKVWAALAVLAVVIACLDVQPKILAGLAGGAAGGFALSVLPFWLASRGHFISDVFIAQAERGQGGFAPEHRLADLIGMPGLSQGLSHPSGLLLVVLVYALITGLGVLAYSGPARETGDRLARLSAVATVIVGIGLLMSSTYYYHYAAFMAPFMALFLGVVAERLVKRHQAERAAAIAVPAVALLLIATMAALRLSTIAGRGEADSVRPQMAALLARGHGCVFALDPLDAIMANDFTAATPGCPHVIDWLGQERVMDGGAALDRSDVRNSRLQRWLLTNFKDADVLILSAQNHQSLKYLFSPAIRRYLRAHFAAYPDTADAASQRFWVYLRTGAS